MKLVNVEDLKVLVAVESKGDIRYGKLVTDLFDDIPTVNAIPIEWLNKRAEEIAFAYWTNAKNKVTLPLNELPLLIDQIIGEWEKENEKG